MMMCIKARAIMHIPTRGTDLSFSRHRPEKVVVVMGATGTGKSRLSIDIATRFSGEIINSDKIQVYEGLDIATNKITEEECRGVPHHLLGIVDPDSDFNAENFVSTASLAMKSIVWRRKLPIIAGGSNSFIEALVDDENYEFRSRLQTLTNKQSYSCRLQTFGPPLFLQMSADVVRRLQTFSFRKNKHHLRLKYDVCFLWVDVAMLMLEQFVSDRVDRMVEAGMVDEVRNMYNPNADYSKGIRRAIGVPEFDLFFRAEYSSSTDQETRTILLENAIIETKINTCKLARKQIEKIHRLKDVRGWPIHRLDATKVLQKKGREADKAWEELVAGPASMIVNDFRFGYRDFPQQRRSIALGPRWQPQLSIHGKRTNINKL